MTVPDQAPRTEGKFSCLIVEDDAAFGAMASEVVRQEGGDPVQALSLSAARDQAANRSFDLVLLDNHLPDGKGYDFFEQVGRRNPEAPIIMITGVPDLREAVALTRNGLFEYITKPVSVDALAACLGRAKLRLRAGTGVAGDAEWFGESAASRDVLQQLRQAARHPASTVLLTGETGAGKDLAARILHQLSFPEKTSPTLQ